MTKSSKKIWTLLPLLLALAVAHAVVYRTSEPFFYNDETRHVMTGVYFRDLLFDVPVGNLREYTISYYLQYPSLGLLVWPPFFHALEGLLMSVFGTSMAVPLALVGLFAAAACAYLFLLVCRTHDLPRAAAAVLLFGLAPLVFEYSHYVMLEVPTLALALGAIYHFTRYLDSERRRDLALAALFSALAALTRFDAVYLPPLFLMLVAARRRWSLLRRREVLAAAGAAALIVLPFFALMAGEIGWFHLRQATETLSPNFPGYLSLSRYVFYPSHLPSQVGALTLLLAGVGMVAGLAAWRRESLTYYAMIAATYFTFTPIGEMDSRHAIYWVPAFSFFAAHGLFAISAGLRAPKLYLPLAVAVVAAASLSVLSKPRTFVRGYEEAARYVASQPDAPPFCLFVGRLNGDFIYQIRRHDAARRVWVLRADKLFYSVLVHAQTGYRQYATGETETLELIYKYDPAFLVVEEPPGRAWIEAEDRLRAVIENHPERFRLESEVRLDSNAADFAHTKLKIYRNTFRNPDPERTVGAELLMLRRTFQTVVP